MGSESGNGGEEAVLTNDLGSYLETCVSYVEYLSVNNFIAQETSLCVEVSLIKPRHRWVTLGGWI